ncbi:MAG: RDD family protein [Inquilinus sp.]|nr:RDD family protein [Inquilinus sp.]
MLGPSAQQRRIVTPEGVALTVELAPRGDRAAALLIDLLIIVIALALLTLLVFLIIAASFGRGGGWMLSFILIAAFLLRSFYFVYFELRWQGTTPGKRKMGLRVIDRAGGPLRTDAVFARNLMREVEVFMPIAFLFGAEAGDLFSWLALIWALVFVLLPFFNKDRLRAGDIVAGTWVVTAPKAVLLSDLADPKVALRPLGSARPDGIAFTAEQLAIYGIYELQTLESVLRGTGPDIGETRAAVADRIQRKIGWIDPAAGGRRAEPKVFLEAFYGALRQHLETRMLFGVRRKDKHDKR